jgi:hypothetical protein
MDAQITRGNPENYADETYRDYLISYDHNGGVFYVSKGTEYRRGISSLRRDAKRWVDMLISGKVR